MHMWNFRTRTIASVAFLQAVLLAVLVIAGGRHLSDSAESALEQRSQATVQAFSALARPALVGGDLAALHALTREMLTYPGVVYARVRGEHRQVLAQAGDAQQLLAAPPRQAGPTEARDGVYRLDRDVLVNGQRSGQVEVGLATAPVQRLKTGALWFGLGLAALEVLLVAVLLWALGTQRSRQRNALAENAQAVRLPLRSAAPAEAPAADVLDPVRYEQVRTVMGDAMGALLDKVQETLESELRQMQAAAAQGRIDTMRNLLHRIKNTAGDIGAMRLHALAARVEQGLLRENAPMPDIGPLELACTDALATVRQLIAARPSPRPPSLHP
jgi:HPt (histidine-containing phosphotransfer) domain-containing protein